MKTIKQEKSKEAGFVIPDHYFEKLSSNIAGKTYSKSRLKRRSTTAYLVAASLALLIGASAVIYHATSTLSPSEEETTLYATAKDTATKTLTVKTQHDSATNTATLMKTESKDESLDNAILEVAEELNLTDEELIELAELTEI